MPITQKAIAEAIVEMKERVGDLEIDTIIGKNHKGAAVTINDRATGYLWIRKLSGKEAAPLADKTIEALLPYKKHLKTIEAVSILSLNFVMALFTHIFTPKNHHLVPPKSDFSCKNLNENIS